MKPCITTNGTFNTDHVLKLAATICTASLLWGGNVYAQDQNPAQSVLQQRPAADYSHLTEMPDTQDKNLGDRCIEMLREVEALKGKPQRRSTAMARYRAECERR